MNDAFINIALQITSDSQRISDLDFDDVALYEFFKSTSGNQSFEIPPITEAQMLDLIKRIPSSKAIGCFQNRRILALYFPPFNKTVNYQDLKLIKAYIL